MKPLRILVDSFADRDLTNAQMTNGRDIIRRLDAKRFHVTVFCLGLDSMAFRSWCEDTVRTLADGVEGVSEWTRPPVPESGFTEDRPVQSRAVPKATHAA